MKSQVEMIRDQLSNQPIEDVYSKNFAGKEISRELFNVFFDVFEASDLKLSDIEKSKYILLSNWIDQENNERLLIDKFPSYIKFYIKYLYRDNGLRTNIYKHYDLVVRDDSADLENYKLLIKKKNINLSELNDYANNYEFDLRLKDWLTKEDHALLIDLVNKREKVIEFENYIYDLEAELGEVWDRDDENMLNSYKEVYDESIVRLKIEIAEIRLFGKDENKIGTLENLINYFTELREDYTNYNLFVNSSSERINQEDYDIPINIQDQEKFIYCSKLGVIDFLKKKIEESGVKYTDKKLYPLLVNITGNNPLSVKKLMSYHNKPHHDDPGNPFNNNDLMTRVKTFLFNNDFKL